MRIIRLPLLVNHLERRDDRYLEGRGMSYSKSNKKVFVKLLPEPVVPWVRFTMKIDITVLAGLEHFFPVGVFHQTGWHCKFCFGSLLSRSIVGLVDLTNL
jgi:hypothetical protein